MITRDQFPENVRWAFDEMEKMFSAREQRLDDDFMILVTWQYWGRMQTNKELCDQLKHVLRCFDGLGKNTLTVSLYEVVRRLDMRPRHQRLFPEERILKKGKK